MPACSESFALVTFRGGVVADCGLVQRLLDIEARGCSFRLEEGGRFRVTPPDPRWTSENRPLIDRAKPATTRVASETNGVLLQSVLGAQVGLDFGAPAARSALQDVRVME